jgi:hypothetical protein
MHVKLFIPPLVALAVSIALVGSQRGEISRVAKELVVMRKQIADSQEVSGDVAVDRGSSRPATRSIPQSDIDWSVVGTSMKRGQLGGVELSRRDLKSLREKLRAMDQWQLLDALEDIKGQGLGEEQQAELELLVQGYLAEKNPEMALDLIKDRIDPSDFLNFATFKSQLSRWARIDPDAASAWLDRQIDAGAFEAKSLDGKNEILLGFEASISRQLLDSNPTKADERFSSLPYYLRKELLADSQMSAINSENWTAFAELVRNNLDPGDVSRILGEQVSRVITGGGLDAVSDFMDRTGASTEERISFAEKAVEKLQRSFVIEKPTVEEVEAIRTWLAAEAPGSVEGSTGELLGYVAGKFGGEQASSLLDLALMYYAKGSDEKILTGFAEGMRNWEGGDALRRAAAQVSDPSIRETLLKNLN